MNKCLDSYLHNIMLRVLRLFFFTELCINIKYKRVDGEGGEAMTLNGSSGVQCKILKCYQLLGIYLHTVGISECIQ